MSSALETVGLVALVVAWPCFAGEGLAQAPAASLALTGATIYPSPEHPAIHDGVVLLRGGRIAAVGRRSEVAVPAGTEALD